MTGVRTSRDIRNLGKITRRRRDLQQAVLAYTHISKEGGTHDYPGSVQYRAVQSQCRYRGRVVIELDSGVLAIAHRARRCGDSDADVDRLPTADAQRRAPDGTALPEVVAELLLSDGRL